MRLTLPCLAVLIAILPPAAHAQGASAGFTACPPPANYDACAMRVEQRFFSGTRLVRGISGEEVGRVSLSGDRMASMLRGSDSAMTEGRRYSGAGKRAMVLSLLSGGLVAAAILVEPQSASGYFDRSPEQTALLVGGAVLSIPAAYYALRSQRHLSRAVWWYNRDLAAQAGR